MRYIFKRGPGRKFTQSEELNRVLLGEVLSGDAERALNESHLAHNVGLCQPADLTLANNVHCFISGNRVHGAIDGAERLAGGDSFLQESVVLLENVLMYGDRRHRQFRPSSPADFNSSIAVGYAG